MRPRAGVWGWALALAVSAMAARGEAVLHEGEGGWGVVSGVSGTASAPGADWEFADGLWMGRIPAGAERLDFGGVEVPVEGAEPLPLAPVELSMTSNPFGPCVVRSLSVRYDAQVRARRWSLVFAPEGEAPAFAPLEVVGGGQVGMALWLEDAETGERQELRPERMGREGGMFAEKRGEARFYAGSVDEGDVEWNLLVSPGAEGRVILQGRVMAMKSMVRRLRMGIQLRTGGEEGRVLQEEAPPAVVSMTGGVAVALFADLAEPRRFRAMGGEGGAGLEFDLGVTKATGNFPRSATFSVEVASWDSEGLESAKGEAVGRLVRVGGGVALPEAVRREGEGAMAVFEPSRMRLAHRGGFRDARDAQQYLMTRMSGLFADPGWAASAHQCAARDGEGEARVELAGEGAIMAVNADPDLETLRSVGPNRGWAVLERIRRAGASAVLIRAAGRSPGLDHNGRALWLCDYPAVWAEGGGLGVDLGHAEAELIAAVACVLREEGICLVVADSGPLAPFTTAHADALACESAEPEEMRRQRALAGERPVVWLAEGAGGEAEELARNLGFVRPGKNQED